MTQNAPNSEQTLIEQIREQNRKKRRRKSTHFGDNGESDEESEDEENFRLDEEEDTEMKGVPIY